MNRQTEFDRNADPADTATDNEIVARENAIERSRAPEGPVFTGYCHYCEAGVSAPRRWCNAVCRDLYEAEASRRTRR